MSSPVVPPRPGRSKSTSSQDSSSHIAPKASSFIRDHGGESQNPPMETLTSPQTSITPSHTGKVDSYTLSNHNLPRQIESIPPKPNPRPDRKPQTSLATSEKFRPAMSSVDPQKGFCDKDRQTEGILPKTSPRPAQKSPSFPSGCEKSILNQPAPGSEAFPKPQPCPPPLPKKTARPDVSAPSSDESSKPAALDGPEKYQKLLPKRQAPPPPLQKSVNPNSPTGQLKLVTDLPPSLPPRPPTRPSPVSHLNEPESPSKPNSLPPPIKNAESASIISNPTASSPRSRMAPAKPSPPPRPPAPATKPSQSVSPPPLNSPNPVVASSESSSAPSYFTKPPRSKMLPPKVSPYRIEKRDSSLKLSVPSSDSTKFVPNQSKPRMRAKYDCKDPTCLNFQQGDILFFEKYVDSAWIEGEFKNQRGFVPVNFIEFIDDISPQISPTRGSLPSKPAIAPKSPTSKPLPSCNISKTSPVKSPPQNDSLIKSQDSPSREVFSPEDDKKNQSYIISTLPPPASTPDSLIDSPAKHSNSPSAKNYWASKTYEARSTDELSFQQGDRIEKCSSVDDLWFLGQTEGHSAVGYVLYDDVVNSPWQTDASPGCNPQREATHSPSSGEEAVALYDYEGELEVELSFSVGTHIVILERVNEDWLKGQANGKIGIFPDKFVEIKNLVPSTVVEAAPSLDRESPMYPSINYEEIELSTYYEDYQTIDSYADSTPKDFTTVEEIVGYFQRFSLDTKQLCRIVFRWIATNISYDCDSFFSGNLSAEKSTVAVVLQRRMAVCEGYANLYQSMCDALGVQCEKVTGTCRGFFFQKEAPHAWNKVRFGDPLEWHIVDSCWGAGAIQGRSFRHNFCSLWFDMPPEVAILDHFPTDEKSSLLNRSLSKILHLPFYKASEMWNHKITCSVSESCIQNAHPVFSFFIQGVSNIGEIIDVQVRDHQGLLTFTGRSLFEVVGRDANSATISVKLSFPAKGLFQVCVRTAHRDPQNISSFIMYETIGFLVHSEAASHFTYPLQHLPCPIQITTPATCPPLGYHDVVEFYYFDSKPVSVFVVSPQGKFIEMQVFMKDTFWIKFSQRIHFDEIGRYSFFIREDNISLSGRHFMTLEIQ